jgi:hypothetical protein
MFTDGHQLALYLETPRPLRYRSLRDRWNTCGWRGEAENTRSSILWLSTSSTRWSSNDYPTFATSGNIIVLPKTISRESSSVCRRVLDRVTESRGSSIRWVDVTPPTWADRPDPHSPCLIRPTATDTVQVLVVGHVRLKLKDVTKEGTITTYNDTTSQYSIEFQDLLTQVWTLVQVKRHWRVQRHGNFGRIPTNTRYAHRSGKFGIVRNECVSTRPRPRSHLFYRAQRGPRSKRGTRVRWNGAHQSVYGHTQAPVVNVKIKRYPTNSASWIFWFITCDSTWSWKYTSADRTDRDGCHGTCHSGGSHLRPNSCHWGCTNRRLYRSVTSRLYTEEYEIYPTNAGTVLFPDFPTDSLFLSKIIWYRHAWNP